MIPAKQRSWGKTKVCAHLQLRDLFLQHVTFLLQKASRQKHEQSEPVRQDLPS